MKAGPVKIKMNYYIDVLKQYHCYCGVLAQYNVAAFTMTAFISLFISFPNGKPDLDAANKNDK